MLPERDQMNCAVCGVEICTHGRQSVSVRDGTWRWKCLDCGEEGDGQHPYTYYVPMYEGRVVDPDTHEWGGYPACRNCAERPTLVERPWSRGER